MRDPHSPPSRVRSKLSRRLRAGAALALAFALGVVVTKWVDRPMAGTLRNELSEQLVKRLESKRALTMDNVPVLEAITQIGKLYDVSIAPSDTMRATLERVGRPITIDRSSASLYQMLDFLEAREELYAIVDGDSILLVDHEAAGRHKTSRYYDVGHVIDRLGIGLEGHDSAYGLIRDRIHRFWEESALKSGPSVQVNDRRRSVIVHTTLIRQQQVASMLNELWHEMEGSK